MGRRARGEGTVYQRPDGTWVSQPFVKMANGEKKRIFLHGEATCN